MNDSDTSYELLAPEQWPLSPLSKIEPRSIFDNIHGNIQLHHPLQHIVDTKAFQRLRDLKQLGLVHMVYPSGVHNRFSHSLGTYWLAHRMVEHLSRTNPSLGITSEDHLCVSIAALCHDIGHGPFSHLFDGPFQEAVGSSNVKHEDLSKALIRRLMLSDEVRAQMEQFLGEGEHYEMNIQFICELVGCQMFDEENEWLPKGRPEEKSFLFDIVSNYHDGFDVDKWDYLVRDSTNTGVAIAFTTHSIDRIIENARVLADARGLQRICYAKKIIDTLQQVGIARQRLHETVYQHKTVRAIENMVVRSFILASPHLEFLGDDGLIYPLSRVTENLGAYLRTNDFILNQIACSSSKELAAARDLLEQVERRNVPVRIDEVSYDPNNDSVSNAVMSLCGGGAGGGTEMELSKVIEEEVRSRLFDVLDPSFDPSKITLITRALHRGLGCTDPMSKVLLFDHKQKVEAMVPGNADPQWIRLKASTSPAVMELGIYVSREYKERSKASIIKEAFRRALMTTINHCSRKEA